MDARHLARALVNPAYAKGLDARGWAALLAMSDAEDLTASLAWRLGGLAVPDDARARLAAAREAAEAGRSETMALVRTMAGQLDAQGIRAVLLDEAAWIAAGLDAARGCKPSGVTIAVSSSDEVQAAGRIDLPIHILTSPGCGEAGTIRLENGLQTPAPEGLVMAAVIGLLGRGKGAGRLSGLWALDRLIREFSPTDGFWQRLHTCSAAQARTPMLSRALRLAHHLFETPVDSWLAWKPRQSDIFYLGRILARDARGAESRRILRLAFRLGAGWRV